MFFNPVAYSQFVELPHFSLSVYFLLHFTSFILFFMLPCFLYYSCPYFSFFLVGILCLAYVSAILSPYPLRFSPLAGVPQQWQQ